ncbi:hypothetical protein [Anaerocolumna sp.]|uniref:hypothetical protein n=1 Tax=Anaerocolumna sp. TaxID=2041569 RepID=UPI0028A8476A|nr:hypothetical protein [Anaerocolumna sp.]
MGRNIENNPTSEQVRLIFKHTYLLYTKFKDSKTEQDYQNLVKECHELQERFPFELCDRILLEICKVINKDYREGVNNIA